MPIFRRRPFPRRRQPLPPGWRHPRDLPPAARNALRSLKRAHKLMAQGQVGQAWIETDEVEKSITRVAVIAVAFWMLRANPPPC